MVFKGVHTVKIGEQIRYFRTAQQLLQSDLAKGICSTSYLSKIENNQTLPSDEIILLLTKRLNVELHISNCSFDELYRKLYEWYEIMFNRHEEKAHKMYQELKNSLIKDPDLKLLFQLYECLYFLNKKKIMAASKLIEEIDKFVELLSDKNTYYYLKFKGIYLYLTNQPHEAMSLLKQAMIQLNTIETQRWEKGYLYYLLGLVASKLWLNMVCTDYINQALLIFERIYCLRRCADCKILLAITFQRMGEYEKAEEEYHLAMILAESIHSNRLKGTILHNKGQLASLRGNSMQAINFYEESLAYKDALEKASTIYTLIEEYYRMQNYNRGISLVKSGMELVKDNEIYKTFAIHYQTYYYLLTKGIEDNDTMEYLTNTTVPYFLETQNWFHLMEYSEMLARAFEQAQKYKSSSYYYSLANIGLKNLNQMKGGVGC
jgi:transcriptional regulator with XRE-family HTH domain